MQNRPTISEDTVYTKMEEGKEDVAAHEHVLANVTDEQVIVASSHGQDINIKVEDSDWIKFILTAGAPIYNFFVAEGIKRFIEDFQGPMAETPFGPYGNDIFDSSMPIVLTGLAAIGLSAAFKNPKFFAEQISGIAGAVGAGAVMQGVGFSSFMAAREVPVVGAEAVRATLGGVAAYLTKRAGLFAWNAATTKTKDVVTAEEQTAEQVAMPENVRMRA